MAKNNKYIITSALPYANGPIHIGHLAGAYLPADIYARYLRKSGKDIIFICGSDEHGVPITIKAKKEKKTPKELVDKYHNIINSSLSNIGISFDWYSRTTNQTHKDEVINFFNDLFDKGEFYSETNEQFFDKKEDCFLPDRYLIGQCPKCGFEKAYGDQCENCGRSIVANELINPKSILTNDTPELKKTKHWYIDLSKFQSFINEWIESKKGIWKTNVIGQVKSWLDEGLKPRPISRDLKWGIKLPFEQSKGKVFYVWFDALLGYISMTKEWADNNNEDWKQYWYDKNTKLVNFIGKDNIFFHCVIFPILLKLGKFPILPYNVPANEFLNLEGHKISTSKNYAIWLDDYIEEFPNNKDSLRYYLISNAPENKDSDFTWEGFQLSNNSELIGILGNFVNRVVILVHKYFDGETPQAELREKDLEILNRLDSYRDEIFRNIESFCMRKAMEEFMNIARLGNLYLSEQQPWKLVKNDIETTKSIIYVSLQIVTALGVLSEPFLPFFASKLTKIMNIKDNLWRNWDSKVLIKPNSKINEIEGTLFYKIEDEKIDMQKSKL